MIKFLNPILLVVLSAMYSPKHSFALVNNDIGAYTSRSLCSCSFTKNAHIVLNQEAISFWRIHNIDIPYYIIYKCEQGSGPGFNFKYTEAPILITDMCEEAYSCGENLFSNFEIVDCLQTLEYSSIFYYKVFLSNNDIYESESTESPVYTLSIASNKFSPDMTLSDTGVYYSLYKTTDEEFKTLALDQHNRKGLLLNFCFIDQSRIISVSMEEEDLDRIWDYFEDSSPKPFHRNGLSYGDSSFYTNAISSPNSSCSKVFADETTANGTGSINNVALTRSLKDSSELNTFICFQNSGYRPDGKTWYLYNNQTFNKQKNVGIQLAVDEAFFEDLNYKGYPIKKGKNGNYYSILLPDQNSASGASSSASELSIFDFPRF